MKLTTGGEDKELESVLDAGLTDFNRRATGAGDEAGLSVRATDDEGAVAGGLTGWTWGGCCGVSMLWVREDQRGTGLGTRLMRAAEEEARRRGCRDMVVSSFSFQAPGFYRKLGYVETGRTEGIPGGNVDVHFHKRLDADGAGAPPRFQVAAVLDLPPDDVPGARAHEDRLLALLPRHGGRLERRLRTDDGHAEVHLLSFPSEPAYRAFLADPSRPATRTRASRPGSCR
ncbi:N-acetyltransferase [Streptomyces sp. TRM64462]|uniref:GNAT family N-acetyltransferase n=1 Tax=Streptomyces sp. TRM64462 TaxID=2741726 RepID=UPI001586618B|nr:GNAT family N-acetyltransferase [Streptomyces sp. TRM64462]